MAWPRLQARCRLSTGKLEGGRELNRSTLLLRGQRDAKLPPTHLKMLWLADKAAGSVLPAARQRATIVVDVAGEAENTGQTAVALAAGCGWWNICMLKSVRPSARVAPCFCAARRTGTLL